MPKSGHRYHTKLKKLRIKLGRIVDTQKNRNFTIVLLSAIVGLTVGLAAILIKQITYAIENYAVSFFPGYVLFLVPLVGLLLVNVLNQTLFKKTSYFKGMRNVIDAIENHQSLIKLKLIYTKVISAAVTIGFGGSSGMESAIITSGASIGSNLGRRLGLSYKLRTLLIGCGTASGISAMYNAPIGGFLFALEVVLPGFTPALLIPLLISSAAGKILFELIMGENLRFDVHINEFSYQSMPYVIIIGIAGMLTASYMTKAYSFCYRKLARLGNPWLIALAGGSILGALIYFFPSLYGEGYVSINKLLHGQEPALWKHSLLANPVFQPFNGLLLILGLLLLRPITTGLSLAAGGEGGYFAPSLVAGGLMGYVVFKTVYVVSGDLAGLAPNTFVFLGMAATFACVMRAPVTAIFLIADTTESYTIIVPLMIVTAVAYTVKNYFDKMNPLVSAGHGTIKMEKFIINQINLNDIVDPVKEFVNEDDTLREIIEHFSVFEHALVPVINADNKIVGIVELKAMRSLLKDFEAYDIKTAKEIMDTDFEVVEFNALRKKLATKPSIINDEHLLVRKNGQVTAYVSRYKLLMIYNQYLSNPDLLFSK